MTRTTLGAIALSLALAPLGAGAAPVDRIFAFGDSLNDCCRNPAAPFINGPETWLVDFAGLVGADYPTPETPTRNYAAGGAQSGPVNAVLGPGGVGVPDGFLSQVAEFESDAPAIGPNDLAVIWVGTNDIWASAHDGDLLFGGVPFNRPAGRQPSADVFAAHVAGNIGTGLAALRDGGFRQALVLTPYDMSQSALWDTDAAQALNGLYARTLRDRLATLHTPGVDTYVLDMVAVLEALQAGAPGNGFTSLTGNDACRPPDDRTECGGHVFLDFVHLTAATNSVVAAEAAALVRDGVPVAPVPLPAGGLLLAGALGGLAIAGRRAVPARQRAA